MGSTVEFMAVKCCECSMMQVKQKKKSNNKWTCAVCNKKQSLLKVFAKSYMAKDLRKFVQSFNMSHASGGSNFSDEDEDEFGGKVQSLSDENHCRKRRSDWTEYLDMEDCNAKEEDDEQGDEDDFGVKIVTELPKEMFKKPKMKCSRYGDGDRSSKQILSKGKEGRKYETATGIHEEERTNQAVAAKSSKWNAYLTPDDDNDFNVASTSKRRNFTDDNNIGQSNFCEVWEDEQKVVVVVEEEEIHPDFI